MCWLCNYVEKAFNIRLQHEQAFIYFNDFLDEHYGNYIVRKQCVLLNFEQL